MNTQDSHFGSPARHRVHPLQIESIGLLKLDGVLREPLKFAHGVKAKDLHAVIPKSPSIEVVMHTGGRATQVQH